MNNNGLNITLQNLLSVIDPYQYIKIQFHGDTLYQGQRIYFDPTDKHSDIRVLNILNTDSKILDQLTNTFILFQYITICIDKDFG